MVFVGYVLPVNFLLYNKSTKSHTKKKSTFVSISSRSALSAYYQMWWTGSSASAAIDSRMALGVFSKSAALF